MELQAAAARAAYENDGYLISGGPVLPTEVVAGALKGMDEVRAGRYDTGIPPRTTAGPD